MTGVLTQRSNLDTEATTHRGKVAVYKPRREARTDPPLRPSEEAHLADTLRSDFQPPEL